MSDDGVGLFGRLKDKLVESKKRWAQDGRLLTGAPDPRRAQRLPPGQRTSVFAPRSRSVAPVCAWALRLWPWEDRDLFHGLVRVEVAPACADSATADLLSRRLLAERAPLSTPDPRWDRLLYGIHSVEQYLRARSGALV